MPTGPRWFALLLLAAACQPGERPVQRPQDDAAPSIQAPEQPGAQLRRRDDTPADPCVPLPKPGEACPTEGSWCVIDWGETCGASDAMWCRDGTWIREQETNECEGD